MKYTVKYIKMNKLEFKHKILEKAKERQQEIIDDFKTSIKELESSEMHINEDQFDSDQQSLDATSNDMINKLIQQLNFVEEEMHLLNSMSVGEELHSSVLLGSVVKTDKLTFFPSVSIEKFQVDGEELFGISTKAPLFKSMLNKKTGEQFGYNDEYYKIEEVY